METEEIILSPDHIPVLSKANAKTFHQQAKERIFEHGGVLEYIETIKFFEALKKVVFGDSSSKTEPDKEFLDYAIEEIKKNSDGGDKATFTTSRGVKFSLCEVASSFDFSMCNDPELLELEARAKESAAALKEKQEYLKSLPTKGEEVRRGDELVTIYPPSKSSKSSFKVTIPR